MEALDRLEHVWTYTGADLSIFEDTQTGEFQVWAEACVGTYPTWEAAEAAHGLSR